MRDLLACHRATGKARAVDVRANDGMGTDEFSVVNGVLGGRWIWTSLLSSAAESADARDDRLTDLRNGRMLLRSTSRTSSPMRRRSRCPACSWSPTRRALSPASPTAASRSRRPGLLTAPAANGGAGLLALERGGADDHAFLPTGDPARTRPRARTVRRCKPRTGARLILRTDALRPDPHRRHLVGLPPGAREDLPAPAPSKACRPVSERHVAYTKPGLIGVFDAVRGSYRELQSTSGAVGAGLLGGRPRRPAGWGASAPAATILSSEPAAEVALGGTTCVLARRIRRGALRRRTELAPALRVGVAAPARRGPAAEAALAVEHLAGDPAASSVASQAISRAGSSGSPQCPAGTVRPRLRTAPAPPSPCRPARGCRVDRDAAARELVGESEVIAASAPLDVA